MLGSRAIDATCTDTSFGPLLLFSVPRRRAEGVGNTSTPRRAAAPEPVDVLVYGVPDSSPYAIWASVNPILTLISMGLGYLGGMIEAAGKPGCTVIMAAAVREAWDRAGGLGARAHPDAQPL